MSTVTLLVIVIEAELELERRCLVESVAEHMYTVARRASYISESCLLRLRPACPA